MNPIVYFNVAILFLFCLVWIASVAFLRRAKQKSVSYLLFFTVFFVYIGKVLDETLFQFQSLLLLRHIIPNLILNGQSEGEIVNIVPLMTLTAQDLRTSMLNILLTIPFGFGLPFISRMRLRNIIVIGAVCSFGIEILQLLTGYAARKTFRIADVNDVIFNTIGVAIGCLLFFGFHRLYRRFFAPGKTPRRQLLRYIDERLDARNGRNG